MAREKNVSGWVGWIYFAAAMLMVSGGINVIAGLTGIFHSEFYVATQTGALLMFDYSAWGWALLVLGLIALALGYFLTQGKKWAQIVTVALVVVSMIVNLAFIGAYPLWTIIALILNGFVVYAVTLHGDELKA